MRREVELLFDSIVREDRSVVDLLTADYTFVNERLAKHYGIPNIYGSQFRRVTLGPDMDVAQGPARQGRVPGHDLQARAHVAGDARQVDHDEHPRHEPAGSAGRRAAAAAARRRRTGNAKEPTMRAEDAGPSRARRTASSAISLMDPIGFALENFDGIGLWRTHGRGHAGRRRRRSCSTTRRSTARSALRDWLADELRRSVRRRRHREAADLRARPRRRVPGHAARPRDRARRRARTTTGSRRWCWASSRASRSR